LPPSILQDLTGVPIPPGVMGREAGKDAAVAREEERIALARLLQLEEQRRSFGQLGGAEHLPPPAGPSLLPEGMPPHAGLGAGLGGPEGGGLEFLQALFPNTRISVQQPPGGPPSPPPNGGLATGSNNSPPGVAPRPRGPQNPLSYSSPSMGASSAPLRPGPVDLGASLGTSPPPTGSPPLDGKMWTPSLRDPAASLQEAHYGLGTAADNQQLLAAMALAERQRQLVNQMAMAGQQQPPPSHGKGDKRGGGQKRGKG